MTHEHQAHQSHEKSGAGMEKPEIMPEAPDMAQQIQRAFDDPNDNTLTPSVIKVLQRTHGNQYVSRLVKQMRAGHPPTIQRRVPEANDIDNEALQTANPADNAANIEGLRTILRRMLHPIDAAYPETRRIPAELAAMNFHGIPVPRLIETGTADQLLALIRRIEAHPAMQGGVLRNTTDTHTPANRLPNAAELRTVIDSIHVLMSAIAGGSYDNHLRDVFGTDAHFGWQQAKPRFTRAADEMRQAFNSGVMVCDRTGAGEQMFAGGLTGFNGRFMVDTHYLNNPSPPFSRGAIVHESFHYSFRDVGDEGGYNRDEAFRRQSARAKFQNAEHYAEVFLRTIGAGESGVVYTPEASRSQHRTPTQLAFDAAAVVLRRGWAGGVRVHDTIRDNYNFQHLGGAFSREEVASLQHHSNMFMLTYHRRFRGINTPLNEIDIALAEGVVRRLDQLQRILENIGATLPFDPHGQTLTRDNYIRTSLRQMGNIVGGTERDLQMILYMSRVFDDLPTAHGTPAWFSL